MKQKTLVVDGNWNLKRNFMKLNEMFSLKGEHCGGSFGFLDSLRSVVNYVFPDRVVVMWDGEASGKLRKEIYPSYKGNRDKSWLHSSQHMSDNVYKYEEQRKYSILNQKIKVKNYLEELFIRQLEVDFIEADDLIAGYVQYLDENEQVVIYSSDQDFYQLINENVSVLRPSDKKMITIHNFKELFEYDIKNALLLKCFEGDDSDNITGIEGIGLKTILKFFPKFADEEYDIDRIISESVELYKSKKLKTLEKIIGSRRIFERNKKLMNLKEPFLPEESLSEIEELKNCIIYTNDNFNDRSINNAMKMMIKDGYTKLVYNNDMESFFKPFYRLVTKEKEYSKKVLNS
jgi:5'-3' exonuclease